MRRGRRARDQREPRHRSDARQRLAAKPQRGDAFQIIQRGDLAGGVPRQRQRDLLRVDADAVVAHADQAAAAALQLHLDARGAGVERVLHQLLDHGRRPLDHLAGGDLIDECIGKKLNGQGRPRCAHFRTARSPAKRPLHCRSRPSPAMDRPRRWSRLRAARCACPRADWRRNNRARPDGWRRRAWPDAAAPRSRCSSCGLEM